MLSSHSVTPDKNAVLSLRLWTIKDYYQMRQVGILDSQEKVELIAGQIIQKMSPQNSPHAAAIRRADRLLGQRLDDSVMVQKQLPIQLNNYSEPEPDIAVIKADPLDYDEHHPTAKEVYLIIEIADSTVRQDCGIKAVEYAKSGIRDYWVLKVNQRQLIVYREPTKNGYQSELILGENDTITPLYFPHCVIRVGEMLRPN